MNLLYVAGLGTYMKEYSVSKVADNKYSFVAINYLKRFVVDDFCYYSPIKNEIQTLFSVSRPSELITGFSRLYSVNDSNFILIEYEVVEWPRFSSLIKLALLDSNFKVLRSKKHIADYESTKGRGAIFLE